jgi:transposase
MFKREYRACEIRKALDIYRITKSFRKAERICGIGKSTIQRWWVSFHTLFVRHHRQRKKVKRRRKPKFEGVEGFLKKLFLSPKLEFISLKQIQRALPYSKPPCLSWLSMVLRKSRISRRRFTHAVVYPNNPSRMEERYKHLKVVMASLNIENIVCLDETALTNFGNTSYGYYLKGKQPQAFYVPRREKVSLIMAIHPYKGIVATSSQQKAFNKETFVAFIKDVLLPSLPSEVQAVLMDNISFHHSKEVLDLLQRKGILPLFIPPYSPRCNPIEEVFSLLKRIFRDLDLRDGSFQKKVRVAVDQLNLYKDFSTYYRHARSHVEETCQSLGL